MTAIVGPNGSGKSTLLKGLSAHLTPASGVVRLDGREIDAYGSKELARELGHLSQENEAPDGITVERLVHHGRHPHRGAFGSADREDYAAAVAKTLLRDRRRAAGFWVGADQYWDWRVEDGTYGDEEWADHVDEWLDGTLPEDPPAEQRVERIRERVKAERLEFHRTAAERERRRADPRGLLREHLFEER